MSLSAFDQAMVDKIKEVFPNVRNAQEDQVVTDALDKKAELTLPIITVWRISNPLAFGQFSSDSMVRRGPFYTLSKEEGLSVQGVPVRIQYQLDIMSDRRTEVDDIFRELALFLYEENSLSVLFKAVGKIPDLIRDFSIQLLDNNPATDFSSFFDRGRLYRETLNVEIPNAELIFCKVRENRTVYPDSGIYVFRG